MSSKGRSKASDHSDDRPEKSKHGGRRGCRPWTKTSTVPDGTRYWRRKLPPAPRPPGELLDPLVGDAEHLSGVANGQAGLPRERPRRGFRRLLGPRLNLVELSPSGGRLVQDVTCGSREPDVIDEGGLLGGSLVDEKRQRFPDAAAALGQAASLGCGTPEPRGRLRSTSRSRSPSRSGRCRSSSLVCSYFPSRRALFSQSLPMRGPDLARCR
jgi:hypothetical protein